ncbi:MAG TPA: hypothetical protein VF600_00240 [Abditibacteriaceae bacterium]
MAEAIDVESTYTRIEYSEGSSNELCGTTERRYEWDNGVAT